MFGVLIRYVVAFVLTKRGKNIIVFGGAMVLCFVTALLIDWRLYLAAAVTGLLAAVMLVLWGIQKQRQRSQDRERKRRKAEDAVRRAAAAQARSEKMDKAKTAVADAARTVSSRAADVTKAGLAKGRDSLSFLRRKRSP